LRQQPAAGVIVGRWLHSAPCELADYASREEDPHRLGWAAWCKDLPHGGLRAVFRSRPRHGVGGRYLGSGM